MWCCTASLRGFNGIYRYNISQNDGAKHGVIDWREGHEGSMAYNNTIYLGEGIDREWLKNGYTGGKSDAKFYNNIVVNKGTMTPGKGFNEQEIDYESNIFVGFDEVPSNDTTLIQEDPKFVAPGTGGKGIDSVKGYKLQADSPAIDAGLNIENNGRKDYFGTPLTDGKTDIGAVEYVVELDKTELNALIEKAEGIDTSKYTEESVKAFEAALAAAKDAYENATTQEELDEAESALNHAIEALQEKPATPQEPTKPQQPADPQKPTTKPDKPQTSEKKPAAKTGDASDAMPMGILAIGALSVVVLLGKKKRG